MTSCAFLLIAIQAAQDFRKQWKGILNIATDPNNNRSPGKLSSSAECVTCRIGATTMSKIRGQRRTQTKDKRRRMKHPIRSWPSAVVGRIQFRSPEFYDAGAERMIHRSYFMVIDSAGNPCSDLHST